MLWGCNLIWTLSFVNMQLTNGHLMEIFQVFRMVWRYNMQPIFNLTKLSIIKNVQCQWSMNEILILSTGGMIVMGKLKYLWDEHRTVWWNVGTYSQKSKMQITIQKHKHFQQNHSTSFQKLHMNEQQEGCSLLWSQHTNIHKSAISEWPTRATTNTQTSEQRGTTDWGRITF
jgi:hypothetical protein